MAGTSPAMTAKLMPPERATAMPRTSPPFRADHVGSLLRPAALKEARAKRQKGEITAEAL